MIFLQQGRLLFSTLFVFICDLLCINKKGLTIYSLVFNYYFPLRLKYDFFIISNSAPIRIRKKTVYSAVIKSKIIQSFNLYRNFYYIYIVGVTVPCAVRVSTTKHFLVCISLRPLFAWLYICLFICLLSVFIPALCFLYLYGLSAICCLSV